MDLWKQFRRLRASRNYRDVSACAIWSRFASARADLVGAPALSRPNLFAGD